MKTIIVPTDFSKTANYALEVAVELSKKYNSKLIVLHLLEIPRHLMDEMSSTNDVVNLTIQTDPPDALFYMKLAQKNFEKTRNLDFMNGVEFEEAIQSHLDFKEIGITAQKHQADLIVMGSHGATGIKEFFVGSNTEKAVRHSQIPVMVIKNRIQHFNPISFAFATDLDIAGVLALQEAKNFAAQINTTFSVLHIKNNSESTNTSGKIEKRYHQLLKAAGIKPEEAPLYIHNDKDVENGLHNAVTKKKIDVLGIATHGRKGLVHLFNENISEKLINHLNVPMVTFKINK